ncbi:MAG: hypothetical protein JWM32_908 [Verrucomicrobia bacterium]|nr:hypothetical protein [Verrucomicrobiota bacterium]
MPASGIKPRRPPFKAYAPYVARIQDLMAAPGTTPQWDAAADAALDGQAGAELRQLVGLATRRRFGAFFTGTSLSARLLKNSQSSGIAYDPTCGMGDLLVAAARKLPLGCNLTQTLALWGKNLAGTDLHREFIAGTKTRLVLLARQRHGLASGYPVNTVENLFPLIRVGNGLRAQEQFRRADRLLMNPPFGQKRAAKGCTWASGTVSRAAEFIVNALEKVRPGAELLAILPDVLRSGSFSARWREKISDLAEVHIVRACGLFDESADVDVFLLRLVRRAKGVSVQRKRWPYTRHAGASRLSDHFTVSVGRVVPHRDPETGASYAYIHPRGVPAWKTMRQFAESRRHEGEAFQAPFVVIRRTSRPEHPHRATGSVIGGRQKILVENHLLVCAPNDGTVRTCRKLLRQLKTVKVNQVLNRRIRCRHLTVTAVKGIPFSAGGRRRKKK